MSKSLRVLAFALLLCAPAPLVAEGAPTEGSSLPRGVSDALFEGRYARIDKGTSPDSLAEWAFARFHLAPTREAYEAAVKAHEAGSELGTFALLLFVDNGLQTRRDLALRNRLNFELRTRLEQREARSVFETFMLSRLHLGDANGLVDFSLLNEAEQKRAVTYPKLRAQWVQETAEAGLAEAMNLVGEAHQAEEAWEEALRWYAGAASTGHAAAARNFAWVLIMGPEEMRNVEDGLKGNRFAVAHGDVKAMINAAVWHEGGTGGDPDLAAARDWIERAAETGHWLGVFEKAFAHNTGRYGFEKNTKLGIGLMQQAARSGHPGVLNRIGIQYANGEILRQDGAKAALFWKAAFIQGQESAAGNLSQLYKGGLPGVEPDEDLSRFWFAHSNASLAGALGLDDEDLPPLLELKEIDPLALTVD